MDDDDCEIGTLGGTQNLKQCQSQKNEGKSMSFFASVTNAKDPVQARDRHFEAHNNEEIPLSFSGLFPKQSEKRKNDDDHHDESSNDSKKQRLSDECDSDQDMFADDDDDAENVDTNNAQLLPFDPKADYEEANKDGKKQDRRKPKNPKKHNGLVSSNFVKIDLKKKNYVRGSKHMTGAKYKRMEFKRKIQGKYGSKR